MLVHRVQEQLAAQSQMTPTVVVLIDPVSPVDREQTLSVLPGKPYQVYSHFPRPERAESSSLIGRSINSVFFGLRRVSFEMTDGLAGTFYPKS
jgi:hypothetical protein